MAAKADCIFCQIVAGRAPSFRVDEDAETISFLDIFPVAAGHTLVVTREHFTNLYEATPAALAAVAAASRRAAHAIRTALAPDGLGVFQLNGAAAGQTVFHYHAHLLPRAAGTELRLHGRQAADRARLAEIAARVAAELA